MDDLSLYSQINALPADLRQQVQDFVAFLSQQSKKDKKKGKKREFGVLKGKIHIAADFDAPLDDFKDYM